MRGRKYWTEKRIIKQILDLKEKGSLLHYSYIETHHKTLAEAGRRIFGTWNDALVAAGINLEEIWKSSMDSKNRSRINVLKQYPNFKEVIAKNVKERRESQGLTQAQLSARTGIRTRIIGCIENGRQIPHLTTLVLLARELNVDLNYFIRGLNVK